MKSQYVYLAKAAFECLYRGIDFFEKSEKMSQTIPRECHKLDAALLKSQDRRMRLALGGPPWSEHESRVSRGLGRPFLSSVLIGNSANLKLLLSDHLIKQDYLDLLRES